MMKQSYFNPGLGIDDNEWVLNIPQRSRIEA